MRKLVLLLLLMIPFCVDAQKVSKKQAKKAEVHFKTSIEQLGIEKTDEALDEINTAISLNPNLIEYHLYKVEVLFMSNKPEEGMGFLNTTIKTFSESPEGYNARGSIFEAIRQFEWAIKDFSKAIEFAKNKKNKALYYSNRGGAKVQIMDYEGAYDDLLNAYNLYPKSLDVLNNLAMVCDEVGKKEETLIYLNKIISVDSTYIPAYVNLGFKYQLMGDHEKAITYLSKAIELNPNEELGYSNLSYSLLQLGKLDEAMEAINTSIDLNPMNPYAYRNRALIYLAKNDTLNACDDIEEGLLKGFSKSYGTELEELRDEHCKGTRN